MIDKEIKEILKKLEKLEKKVDYVVVPKLIEDRKEMIKKATDENGKKALQNQINNLNKHLVGLGTILDLYDAHNLQD